MHVLRLLLLIVFTALTGALTVQSQSVVNAKPGPAGIYLTLGKNIPCGKYTLLYSIERRENSGNWEKIAVVRTPLAFSAFQEEIAKARKLLPSQPDQTEKRMKALYEKAVEVGTTDSLKGWAMPYPIKMALGFMYHDAKATKGKAFQYRITETTAAGIQLEPVLTDTLSMPYKPRFDEVQLVETSSTRNGVYIKWMSAGKNPAPLFMVNRYEGQTVINGGGAIGRYTKNDTTYFTFRDSTQTSLSRKEPVYALTPFDHLGNIGTESSRIMITQDLFNTSDFVFTKPGRTRERTGNLISWQFSNPQTVNTFEVYRSDKGDKGYVRIAVLGNQDTSYVDERIQPSRDYYYYIQAIAKTGKRFKPGNRVKAPAFEMRRLIAPTITEAVRVEGGIRLTIQITDEQSTGFRVFRSEGTNSELIAVSDYIQKAGGICEFFDNDPVLSPEVKYRYAVRVEKPGYSISDLSKEVTVAPLSAKDK